MTMTETLFARAVQLPAGERAAFFDRECAGQPELRGRVEALLAADAQSQLALDRQLAAFKKTAQYTPEPNVPERDLPELTGGQCTSDAKAGTVIAGKYTLVDVIGEGGMGSVWRAKQTEPVKRFVAVKLIDDRNPLADGASTDDVVMWLAYKEAKALIQFTAQPPQAAPKPLEQK